MSYTRLGVAGIAAALLCALSLSARTSGGSPRPGGTQSISGCCNQTSTGGLSNCTPTTSEGSCPSGKIKANCTGQTSTGGLSGCSAAARPGEGAGAPVAGGRPGRRFIPVPEELKPDGFELEEKGGEVVGMTAVMKDGSRLDLTQKPRPARDTVCPAGTTMKCWYSPGGTIVICYCDKPGGGGGGRLNTLTINASF